MKCCRGSLLLLIAGLLTSTAAAADWPQWRGPQRNGISQETGLLQQWPENGPKLLWQSRQVGEGYSTPAVVGDRLYLLGNEGLENEFVRALDVQTGEPIWSTRLGKVGNPDQRPPYPGARSTPTVEGDVLYALGSDGELICADIATGQIRWSKNLRSDFGGRPGEWAYSESPLIDGEKLICTPGGPEATIVALNKTNGELIWKCAVPEGGEAAYASAIAIEVDGTKQYVQFVQSGLVGVEAETGKFLWRYGKTAEGSAANIPTPVAQPPYVYNATGQGGGALIQLVASQGEWNAEEVYFGKKLPTNIGGSVLLDGYLYGTSGPTLMCVELLTGELKWQERGIGAGAVCFADGLLFVYGENGEVALVEATPEAYRERGRFTPPNPPERGRSRAWAYPVVANGRLYVRDLNSLWCYDVQAPAN